MITFYEWCKQFSIKPETATDEQYQAYKDDLIEAGILPKNLKTLENTK